MGERDLWGPKVIWAAGLREFMRLESGLLAFFKQLEHLGWYLWSKIAGCSKVWRQLGLLSCSTQKMGDSIACIYFMCNNINNGEDIRRRRSYIKSFGTLILILRSRQGQFDSCAQ